MTRVGLRFSTGLSFEEWERVGRHLSGIVDSSSWCLGDWLMYGKEHYADRYQRAIRAAGLQYQTLRNYAWVARQFPLQRRRGRLSFQHHAEVASLPLDQQDRLLDLVERNGWTTKQLRTRIQGERAGCEEEKEDLALIPRIQVPSGRLSSWRRAADRSGTDFGSWVLSVLDRAAEQELGERERTFGRRPGGAPA
ncbi:LmbU family transcriptional regulator [Streptomyces sp. LP05-1]|uniref:LmbU family transcriptional regulator n=1 Tax=Streptomyces pyxinae TaxID=2970734 RepID=A0ABT2CPJ6_9ACTN|nr:LmbU family transcriptional regulator [Streptomyces sp. LP05-1]MCS0639365.1 LmbU family transcriptional regulator [Streptomyces sp. LP05-1]